MGRIQPTFEICKLARVPQARPGAQPFYGPSRLKGRDAAGLPWPPVFAQTFFCAGV